MEVLECSTSSFGKRDRDYEVQVAARIGIDNAKRLLQILSHQQRTSQGQDYEEEESHAAAGVAVSKFQKVVSLLSRTGHARFRRAPRNPTRIAGYEYVFFQSANSIQEDIESKRKPEKDSRELSRETVKFAAELPLAAVSAAAAVTAVAALPQYRPSPSSISLADESSDHGNGAIIPTFLKDTQQILHLQLRQQQQQQQVQIQQQVQQLLWHHQQLQVATPVGYFPARIPVLPPETMDSPSKKKKQQQLEASFSKSTFSVMSMADGSAAAETDHNNNNNLQQTSQTFSLPPTWPQPQGRDHHHHHHTGACKSKSKSCSENLLVTGPDEKKNKQACSRSCAGSLQPACHCHCSKLRSRKSRVKRTIRVPAISTKLADIPSDDYSWRKYGQKPIKGSPHPRGYYKCSSMRNCPARKHVERSLEDPSMLIVTYEGEHSHSAHKPSTSIALNVQSLTI